VRAPVPASAGLILAGIAFLTGAVSLFYRHGLELVSVLLGFLGALLLLSVLFRLGMRQRRLVLYASIVFVIALLLLLSDPSTAPVALHNFPDEYLLVHSTSIYAFAVAVTSLTLFYLSFYLFAEGFAGREESPLLLFSLIGSIFLFIFFYPLAYAFQLLGIGDIAGTGMLLLAVVDMLLGIAYVLSGIRSLVKR